MHLSILSNNSSKRITCFENNRLFIHNNGCCVIIILPLLSLSCPAPWTMISTNRSLMTFSTRSAGRTPGNGSNMMSPLREGISDDAKFPATAVFITAGLGLLEVVGILETLNLA